MTWVKGQSGNPLGIGLPKRVMRDALMLAMNEYQEDKNGNKLKRIRLVANALIKKAISGDVPAIKELLDRIDGKVPADLKLTSDKPIDGLSYDELAQGIAEALLHLRGTTDPTEAHNDHEQRREPVPRDGHNAADSARGGGFHLGP